MEIRLELIGKLVSQSSQVPALGFYIVQAVRSEIWWARETYMDPPAPECPTAMRLLRSMLERYFDARKARMAAEYCRLGTERMKVRYWTVEQLLLE